MLACAEELTGSLAEFIDSDNFIAIIAIVLGCFTGMVALVSTTVASIARTRARESTRREIAAYVAEGTLDPDKAVAILNAGMSKADLQDVDKHFGGKA